MSRLPRQGRDRTYAWPALAAAVTIAALVIGLIGTGGFDLVAVLGLSLPMLLCGWKLVRH